jgi:flavorubredoxin
MELAQDIFWIGVVDPQTRTVFGREFGTPLGTSFNSYLIRDRHNVCVACIRATDLTTFVENLERRIDPAKIDYLVFNQVELNDAGTLTVLRRLMPAARLVVPAGAPIPRHSAWDYSELGRGEALPLGSTSLLLLAACGAPWPDSMVLYVPERKVLLSQHLFAQHWASSHRFDDRIDRTRLLNQAMRYYVSMLAPVFREVRATIDSLRGPHTPIQVIAPANGVIWRADPLGIVDAYLGWTERISEKRAVVVYETMLKSTEYMAEAVTRGIVRQGIPCSLRRISLTCREDLLAEIFRSAAVVLGTPTVHRRALPAMAPMMSSVKALQLRQRIGAVFGSYGWSGEAGGELENLLRESGFDVPEKGVYARLRPTAADLYECEQLGGRIATRLQRR